MRLFIRIQNGVPFEHPIFESNFRAAFPEVDLDNLPPDFAEFVRVGSPIVGPYQKFVRTSYEYVDGVWTDVHYLEDLTEQEKLERQETYKFSYLAHGGLPHWVFDEEDCKYYPTARPDDGKTYRFEGTTASWVEVT